MTFLWFLVLEMRTILFSFLLPFVSFCCMHLYFMFTAVSYQMFFHWCSFMMFFHWGFWNKPLDLVLYVKHIWMAETSQSSVQSTGVHASLNKIIVSVSGPDTENENNEWETLRSVLSPPLWHWHVLFTPPFLWSSLKPPPPPPPHPRLSKGHVTHTHTPPPSMSIKRALTHIHQLFEQLIFRKQLWQSVTAK